MAARGSRVWYNAPMLKFLAKMLPLILKLTFYLALGGVTVLALSRLVTGLYAWPRTFNVEDAPARRVAVVFGAGLRYDGTPTAVLRDRVKTGVELYKAGKVEKLLMSGDNSTIYYNEPSAMRDYAISLGVPAEDIVLDYAGRRTYDTCYRAKAIFGLSEVILVTQPFHLPRAIYTCNLLGADAVGVPAQNYTYRRLSLLFWNVREVGATLTALVDVHLTRPMPILGQPEPIFPETAQ